MRRLSLVAGVAAIACCSPSPAPEPKPEPEPLAPRWDVPDWVREGSGLAVIEGAPVFHGVSAVWGIKDEKLAEKVAGNRAAAEVQRLIESFAATVVKESLAERPPGPPPDDIVPDGIQQFIVWPEPDRVAHWVAPPGIHFAQARMGLDQFLANLDQLKWAEPERKADVRERAAHTHARLVTERDERLASLRSARLTPAVEGCEDDLAPLAAGGTVAVEDGGATVRFGDLVLTGVSTGPFIHVSKDRSEERGGCPWRSTLHVAGPLDQLRYYFESGPEQKERQGCPERCATWGDVVTSP